jgi:hypothetical protein
MRHKLSVQVLGNVLDERNSNANDLAGLQLRELAEDLHGARRVHEFLANEKQLRNDAEDVEVDAECEKEAGMSAPDSRLSVAKT